MAEDLERLVQRFRSGLEREESARRLDAELRPRLRRYYRATGFADSEIEDLVQEALLRVLQHVGALRSEERFVPWLFIVARNVARTAGRKVSSERARRTANVDLEALPGSVTTGHDREMRHQLAAVEKAIRSLPEQQRRCLVLVARDELSYRDVGALLGLSPLTVRNHLAQARRRLRQLAGQEVSKP